MIELDPYEKYEGDDLDDCPYCRTVIVGLADAVSDGDWVEEDRCVSRIDCPKCKRRIAVVRTHSYRLTKFKE